MVSLIIDTDIGTDTDDAFAITYAARAGLEVKLISTVHGDSKVRAKIASKLTRLLGSKIPVAAGEDKPIKQKHLYWYGDEGSDFLERGESYDFSRNGVERIVEVISENPHEITIAAIGPLTNIARAFDGNPGLAELVREVFVMGGVTTYKDKCFANFRAHNFKVDPEAVDIVLNSNVKKTIVPTELCKRFSLSQGEIESMKGGNEADNYLSNAAKLWLAKLDYDSQYLYDPLTVAIASGQIDFVAEAYEDTRVVRDIPIDFKDHFLKKIAT